MKKILTLLLTAALLLSFSISAFAYEDSATVPTYETNIMVNGELLYFHETHAEIWNDCAMAPVDVIAKALNIDCVFGFPVDSILLSRGTDTVELMLSGRTLCHNTLDAAGNVIRSVTYPINRVYLKDGHYFVPVRAVAEAFGIKVEWSEAYRTVVLVDPEAAAAKYDGNFTILNAVLAMDGALDKTQGCRGESKLDVKVGIPMLGENGAFSASVSAVAAQKGQTVQGKVQYDIVDLLKLIALMGGDDGSAGEALDVLAAAQEDGLELICDLESGMIYLRGALISLAAGLEEADAKVWYSLNLNDIADMLGTDLMSAINQGTTTVGALIYMLAEQEEGEPYFFMDTLDEAAAELSFLDDSHFTGSSAARHLDIALPDSDAPSISLDVAMFGDKATEVKGSVTYEEDGVKLDCAFTVRPLTASFSGSVTIENMVRVDFALTSDTVIAPDVAVSRAPGADATVVDLFETLFGSLSDVIDYSAVDFAA